MTPFKKLLMDLDVVDVVVVVVVDVGDPHVVPIYYKVTFACVHPHIRQ